MSMMFVVRTKKRDFIGYVHNMNNLRAKDALDVNNFLRNGKYIVVSRQDEELIPTENVISFGKYQPENEIIPTTPDPSDEDLPN